MAEIDEVLHSEKQSISFASLRIPLLVAGLVLGMLLALLAGLSMGRVKLVLERKQFVEQVAMLNQKLTVLENEKSLFDAKEKSLKQKLELQMARAASLEQEIKNAALAKEKSKNEFASSVATQHNASIAPPSLPVKRYVRFGDVDCTVTASHGNQDWQECLKQGRPGSAVSQAIK